MEANPFTSHSPCVVDAVKEALVMAISKSKSVTLPQIPPEGVVPAPVMPVVKTSDWLANSGAKETAKINARRNSFMVDISLAAHRNPHQPCVV